MPTTLDARVSKVPEKKPQTIHGQPANLRLHAQPHSLEIAREFVDDGTGGTTRRSPANRQLICRGSSPRDGNERHGCGPVVYRATTSISRSSKPGGRSRLNCPSSQA